MRATSRVSPCCPRSRSVPAGRGWSRACASGGRRPRPRAGAHRDDRPGRGGGRWPSPRPSSASATPAGSRPTASADELAGWLAANVPDGGRVVMAFREREQMALRLYGDADVAILPIARVDAAEPPGTYLWMGLRDRQLFGYRRAAWTAALAGQASGDPADLLVLVGPHPFTPFALTAAPETATRLGLSPATILEADGDRAEILDVDPAAVAIRRGRRARSTCRPRPRRPGSTSPAATPQPAGCSTRGRSSTATPTPSRPCSIGSARTPARHRPGRARSPSDPREPARTDPDRSSRHHRCLPAQDRCTPLGAPTGRYRIPVQPAIVEP